MLCPHSIVTPERANSIAKLFDLLPARDGDAIRISTTLSTVFHGPSKAVGFPSEPCLHAHPFATSCSNCWVCTNPTSSCQGVTIDHGKLVSHHTVGPPASVFKKWQSAANRICNPTRNEAVTPASDCARYLRHPSMTSSNGNGRLALDLSKCCTCFRTFFSSPCIGHELTVSLHPARLRCAAVCTMTLLPSCFNVTHLKEPRTPCTSRLHVVGQHYEHEIVEPGLGVLRLG